MGKRWVNIFGRMRGILFLALAFGGLLTGCSCYQPTQIEARQEADAIFRGRVLSINHLDSIVTAEPRNGKRILSIPSIDDRQLVTFQIEESWKGRLADRVKVLVTARPGMCDGYEFQEGQVYIVYGTKELRTEWDYWLDRVNAQLGLSAKPKLIVDTVVVSNCPLRIRRDVFAEIRLLNSGPSRDR